MRLGVLQLEVLILEFGSVNGLSATSVTESEVTALSHEAGNDSVEFGALEVERLARVAYTFLASAQCSEVFGGFWNDVTEKAEDDAAGIFAVDCDVEVDLVGDLGKGAEAQSNENQEKIDTCHL